MVKEIKKIKEVNFPHSVGQFYTAFTQFLGFHHYGDEYKVMVYHLMVNQDI